MENKIKELVSMLSLEQIEDLKADHREFGLDWQIVSTYLYDELDNARIEVAYNSYDYRGHGDVWIGTDYDNENLLDVMEKSEGLQEYMIELIKDRLCEVA